MSGRSAEDGRESFKPEKTREIPTEGKEGVRE